MKSITLYVERYIFNTDKESGRSTIGKLYLSKEDTQPFCFTLEDEIRNDGVKVYGETAIPDGTYIVELTMSGRFKRIMPLLYNHIDENGRKLCTDFQGKEFEGVRIHGGNTPENTLGCILIAYNSDGKKIWGTAEKDLTKKLQDYDNINIVIENKPFSHRG